MSKTSELNTETLKKYAVKATEAIDKYSGKFLVRGGKNITLEGNQSPRTVIVEFPTFEEAKESISGDLVKTNDNKTFVGSPQTIRQKLQPILDKVNPEELKIITICEPFSSRVRSYDLINQSFSVN